MGLFKSYAFVEALNCFAPLYYISFISTVYYHHSSVAATEHHLKPLTVVETLLKIDEIPQGDRPGRRAAVSSPPALRGLLESPRRRFIYLRVHVAPHDNAHTHTHKQQKKKTARHALGENERESFRVRESGCTCTDGTRSRCSGGSERHCWPVSCWKLSERERTNFVLACPSPLRASLQGTCESTQPGEA